MNDDVDDDDDDDRDIHSSLTKNITTTSPRFVVTARGKMI